MTVSVLICTYNRAESLRRTLETMRGLETPPGVEWDLMVVDNNSTDDTKQVCASFQDKLPLRYCFEQQRGHNPSLNHGIEATAADLILFTDDDVDVDPKWLAGMCDAARRHPETPFFAGRVIAQFEKEPPRWFREHSTTLLWSVAVHLDFGSEEVSIGMAVGANMAVRAHVFRVGGVRFRDDLGPDGTDTVRSGDAQLFEDLRQWAGKEKCGRFVPGAVIYHRTSNSRTTEKHLRKWYYGDGIARVRRGQIDGGAELWGVPRYLWRKLALSGLRYVALRPFKPSERWLKEEIEMASTFGIIHEWRRRKAIAPPRKGITPAS